MLSTGKWQEISTCICQLSTGDTSSSVFPSPDLLTQAAHAPDRHRADWFCLFSCIVFLLMEIFCKYELTPQLAFSSLL